MIASEKSKTTPQNPEPTHKIARTIFQQILGPYLNGAIVITGGQQVTLHPDNFDLPRKDPNEHGYIDLCNSLTWVPNVRAVGIKFIVTLQPNDTYTVFLYRTHKPREFAETGKIGQVLYRFDEVYFDQLIDVVDDVYVAYLKEHEDGCIPL